MLVPLHIITATYSDTLVGPAGDGGPLPWRHSQRAWRWGEHNIHSGTRNKNHSFFSQIYWKDSDVKLFCVESETAIMSYIQKSHKIKKMVRKIKLNAVISMIRAPQHGKQWLQQWMFPNTTSSQLEPSVAMCTAGEQLTPSLRSGPETASWAPTSCL